MTRPGRIHISGEQRRGLMWADNEADIDLLGFEYLVDELEIVLTERRLLPVTVGVAGEWGSGKSSLMRLAKRRLESEHYGGRRAAG